MWPASSVSKSDPPSPFLTPALMGRIYACPSLRGSPLLQNVHIRIIRTVPDPPTYLYHVCTRTFFVEISLNILTRYTDNNSPRRGTILPYKIMVKCSNLMNIEETWAKWMSSIPREANINANNIAACHMSCQWLSVVNVDSGLMSCLNRSAHRVTPAPVTYMVGWVVGGAGLVQ